MKTKEIKKLKKMVKEIKKGINELGYENVTKACDSLELEINTIEFLEIFRN
jgi:hypothetical protein